MRSHLIPSCAPSSISCSGYSYRRLNHCHSPTIACTVRQPFAVVGLKPRTIGTMSTSYPAASFLGLPTELRLRIYDFVIQLDVDYKIIKDVRHSSDSSGTQATLIPEQSTDFRSAIPWLNLPLICRHVSSELQSYVTEFPTPDNEGNRTYVMDFEVDHPPGRKATRSMTWRRLSCAPHQVRNITINVLSTSDGGPWTEGGPASLARALFQILNRVMHLGPRVFRTALLPKHMEIQNLYINVDVGGYASPPALGCNTDPNFNWTLFLGGWRQISRTGFLTGFVEMTRLKTIGDDSDEVEVATEWQRLPALPGYWRGCGFQWGIECAGYRTL